MKLILILTSVILQDLTQVVQSCSVKLDDSDVKDLIERVLHKKTTDKTSNGHLSREVIAFSATMTKSQSLSQNEVIKFDKEWTNIGNGYNKNTGIFTAPANGVYQFTSTVMVKGNKFLFVCLYHNNIRKTSLYFNAQPGTNFNANTLNIILQLKKGDTISIKSGYNGPSIYSDGAMYSSFSGYLISYFSQ